MAKTTKAPMLRRRTRAVARLEMDQALRKPGKRARAETSSERSASREREQPPVPTPALVVAAAPAASVCHAASESSEEENGGGQFEEEKKNEEEEKSATSYTRSSWAVSASLTLHDSRYLRRKKREYIHEKIAFGSGPKDIAPVKQPSKKKQKARSAPQSPCQVEEHKENKGELQTTEAKARQMETGEPTEEEAHPTAFSHEEHDDVMATPEESAIQDATGEDIVAAEAFCAVSQLHSPVKSELQSPAKIHHAKQEHKTSGIDPTPEKSAPSVATKPKKSVVRGIAQSSSSASTRKRMISFSPERVPRPENLALAQKRLEKNLKTNEKLQQRLQAPTPTKSPAPSRMTTPAGTPSMGNSQSRRAGSFQSPQSRRGPASFQSPQSRHRSPYKSPQTGASSSVVLSQTMELVYDEVESDADEPKATTSTNANASGEAATAEEPTNYQECPVDENTVPNVAANLSQDVCLSQESMSAADLSEKVASLSQQSDEGVSAPAGSPVAHVETSTFESFTSTSVIEDVGLFNCETDVEYTGGVYGEGTDGKVTAAVIGGQKVALKRAKPHEGFPADDAKRRSAVELHYLRKVRHMKGFLQCLGLCDGIDHTCIALEVMDCKLSDYLRNYGVNKGSSKHRRFTLSFEDTKAMLKQVCQPMITLHDQVNVAHGDLACRNILLRTPPKGYEKSWEPDVKLSDFGRIKTPADEPNILDKSFSFFKNCDVGSFGREILYRLLVGEIVPQNCLETRSLHKQLQDVVVTRVPEAAKKRLGPYYNLFMRCTSWGVRPSFHEIYEHLDDLDYFETAENGLFPLKPTGPPSSCSSADSTFMSPEAGRMKAPSSSGSKAHRHDTPTGPGRRPSRPGARLFTSKSFTDAGIAAAPGTGPNKTVNWLKTRSVGTQRVVAPQTFTPNGRPMLAKKKTPPSSGPSRTTSRRSLQILSQIQHRTHGKARKST